MTASTKKKPSASRASRHTKKYWRKGADVSNFEDVLARANLPSGSLDAVSTEELFFEDRTPREEPTVKKRTKRQQAALDKISRVTIDVDNDQDSLPPPKAPSKIGVKRLRQPVVRKEPVVSKKTKLGGKYDLWGVDLTPKLTLKNEEASEHILRNTKKKLPNKPIRLGMKSSLLGAVSLPAPGASYNPAADDYQEYIDEIVQDEVKLMEKEARTARKLKPEHEAIVTQIERELEETEGLVIDPRYGKDDDDENGPSTDAHSEKVETVQSYEITRKTKKQRTKEADKKKEERERKLKKAQKLNENEIFKAKAINKELTKKETEQVKAANERKVKKQLEKLTKRQKLGRGAFEEEDTPFLLQEELIGNLRGLKPQGNILVDRMKSLQKRNILPIGGAKQKAKKLKLRKKFVEKRAAKEVKKGSVVI